MDRVQKDHSILLFRFPSCIGPTLREYRATYNVHTLLNIKPEMIIDCLTVKRPGVKLVDTLHFNLFYWCPGESKPFKILLFL